MRLPIATQQAQGRSVPLSAERLVNMYAEASPQGARSPAWVHNTPGWSSFVNLQSFTERTFGSDPSLGVVNAQDKSPQQVSDIQFKSDGLKMLTLRDGGTVVEWTLSTAWDLSTATETGTTFVGASDGWALYVKPDGTQFWMARASGSQDVLSYTMDAWDISTAVADGDTFDPNISTLSALQMKPDGAKLYLLSSLATPHIAQYTLGTPWDITSATADSKTLNVHGGGNFHFTSDGLEVYEVTTYTTSSTELTRYTLTTPWDISTAGAADELPSLNHSGISGYRGLFMRDDAGQFYVTDAYGNIEEYAYTLTAGASASNKKFIRGMHVTPADGKLYVVVGTSLYYIEDDGTKTLLGSVGGSGRVGMADNGTQLCIVSQGISYVYSVEAGLASISDSDFPNADTVAFIDGYFVFNNNQTATSGQFFISTLLDGTSYDALDFATAERYPDNLKRVFADHSELLLFGDESIEVWYNSGNADFPFSRAQGSVIEQGLGATWSIEKVDESVMWLDNEGVVRRLEGSTPIRKSTHAIEYDIAQGDWQNASAWRYAQEGHDFYVLHVPKPRNSGKGGTYVYDASTDLWHERKSYEKDHLDLGFYAYAYDSHIVGSMSAGKLFEMSLDTYDEAGDPLITEMQFPQIRNEGDRFTVSKFELDMEVGIPQNSTTTTATTHSRDFSSFASVRQIEPSPDVSSGQLSGITFKPDGTKMYTHEVNSTIIEYSLSTAWDISTAAQTDTYTIESDIFKITFKPDGTRFWGVATTPFPDGRVRSYTLSTAWDLTSASTDNDGYTVTADGVYDAQFKPDGTKMYLVQKGNTSGNSVHQYTLSTAWDVTTATADSKTLSLWHTSSTDGNIWLTPEGLHLYEVSDFNAEFKLYRYTLTTPWDISTAGAAEALGSLTSNGSAAYYGLYIAPYLGHFYVADAFGFIEQYSYDYSSTTTATTTGGYTGEPYVMLDVSGNTRTFDMNQPWRTAGKQGEYDTRVIWRRLGQHRSFTPRIRMSFPATRSIYAAYAQIEPNK